MVHLAAIHLKPATIQTGIGNRMADDVLFDDAYDLFEIIGK